MRREDHLSFGVFKPVDHVVMAFPDVDGARRAAAQMEGAVANGDIHYLSDADMLAGTEADLGRAGLLADIGQDLNLIRAHKAMSEAGHHWVIAKVSDDAGARRVAAIARHEGAVRAQWYGRLTVEELIPYGDGAPQAPESPESGLDDRR